MSWWNFEKNKETQMKTIIIKKNIDVAFSIVATLQWKHNTKKETLKSVEEMITLEKLKVLKFWWK